MAIATAFLAMSLKRMTSIEDMDLCIIYWYFFVFLLIVCLIDDLSVLDRHWS